jgi:hypothetical protein
MEIGSSSDPLSRSLVRIFSPEGGGVFGMGFLFSEREVLTCAHVVERAVSAGDGPIFIDFPLLEQPQPPLPAEARLVRPEVRGHSIDAAVLRLDPEAELPAGAWPARLPYGSDLQDHPWRAFGLPEGLSRPVLADGVIKAPRDVDWQLIGRDGYRVVGGFSGAPVWDAMTGAVVGMLYEAEKNPSVKGAFMYPNRVLLEAADVPVDIYQQDGDGSGAARRRVALLPVQTARPRFRRLRVFAEDPATRGLVDPTIQQGVVLSIPWESVQPGPVGEYVEVDDVDAQGVRYAPVDLDHPWLLPEHGWTPSESNPQFHQQMVYAVAMKTIEQFEAGLGRPVLWRSLPGPSDGFVKRLKIRPHGLDRGDASYDPDQVALDFGYLGPGFRHDAERGHGYACLSYDMVAHETARAILDGGFRPVLEPSNPDVAAFHEAIPAIVALLQHLTVPEVVARLIARTRGDMDVETLLGSLVVELGRGTGARNALRGAIGRVESGVWQRTVPDPADLHGRLEPQARAAVLVAAVFDAFVAIHRMRTAELMQVVTQGSGLLPGGPVHPELAQKLATEAAQSAAHVLTMCIRALDYLPPVDVTFFEFLRAVLTADADVFRSDPRHYRAAFAESFRRRGIWPAHLSDAPSPGPMLLSADSLYWQKIEVPGQPEHAREIMEGYRALVGQLERFAAGALYQREREVLFALTRRRSAEIHREIRRVFQDSREFANHVGLDAAEDFEVRGLHSSLRIGPDSNVVPQVILRLVQSRKIPANPSTGTPAFVFHGGATLICDLSVPQVQYRIHKNIRSEPRLVKTARHVRRRSR